MPLLEEIARNFPDRPEAAVALYRIGNILGTAMTTAKLLNIYRLIEAHPEGPEADRAQFAAADILESQGKSNEAIPLYRSLPKKFPNSKYGTMQSGVWLGCIIAAASWGGEWNLQIAREQR